MISIDFDKLADAQEWKVGKVYRVKLVLKQVGMSENYADFEVVDATSLEDRAERSRHYLSGDGSYRAKV